MSVSKLKDPRDQYFSRIEKRKLACLIRRRDFLNKVIEEQQDDPNDWDKAESAALSWIIEKVRQLTVLKAHRKNKRKDEQSFS